VDHHPVFGSSLGVVEIDSRYSTGWRAGHPDVGTRNKSPGFRGEHHDLGSLDQCSPKRVEEEHGRGGSDQARQDQEAGRVCPPVFLPSNRSQSLAPKADDRDPSSVAISNLWGLMLRLGNIDYSNCYPIHGPVLDGTRPDWLDVVDGTPSDLNRRLARGELDVAPGSSIELARHAREYAALRGLCIGSDGPVESIIFSTRLPLDGLDGRKVGLPTASATSRCLLRILLETRLGVRPAWTDFDQGNVDPLGAADSDMDAALYIGDVALRRERRPGEIHVDLGAEWTDWTGLPFVYALWLVAGKAAGRPETGELHRMLLARRDTVAADVESLSKIAGARFAFPPSRLSSYWSRIRYNLDDRMLAGLRRFLDLAAEIGDAPPVTDIRLTP
jgi:chorismate dehydratase